MIVITGGAGFYLASLRSGISAFNSGLLHALSGIAIVSCGASALNQVLERRTDALMKRTRNRPLAAGRIGFAHGLILGFLAIALGSLWLAQLNFITGPADAAHRHRLRRHLHAAQAHHHAGHVSRSLPRSHAAAARLDRRPRTDRVARRRALRHPLRLAVPALHGHRLALPRGVRPRRHQSPARHRTRRAIYCRRSARLRRAHDPRLARARLPAHGRLLYGSRRNSARRWLSLVTPSASPRITKATEAAPASSPAIC